MAGPFLFDRIRETSTTTGTGAISLAGAVSGYRSFSSVLSNGDTCFYVISHQTLAQWEVGRGTYSAGVLTRTAVRASSNGGSAVSFSAGTLDVFITFPALSWLEIHDLIHVLSSNVASASTVNLSTATGDYIHVTGTTTITAFSGIAAGNERTIVFDGALTLTHNATSLILPGGANITTAAGDRMIVRCESTGNYRVIVYTKADGTAVVGGSGNADTITVTDTTNANCRVALFEAATGELAAHTDGKILYDATTGSLAMTDGPDTTQVSPANVTTPTLYVAAGAAAIIADSATFTMPVITQNLFFANLSSNNGSDEYYFTVDGVTGDTTIEDDLGNKTILTSLSVTSGSFVADTGGGTTATVQQNGLVITDGSKTTNLVLTGLTLSNGSLVSQVTPGGTVFDDGATQTTISGGTVTAASLVGSHSGSAAGLTAIPAGQLTGTVADARLSANVPILVGGLLPTSMLPPLAISQPFAVASQSAMLALTAQRGDVAIRSDNSKSYILSTDSPGTLADWLEMTSPVDGVVSVNGQTGPTVTLSAADVGAQAADATLAALAGQTVAANQIIYATGADAFAVTGFTSVARTLVAQTTVTLMRTAGLGATTVGENLFTLTNPGAITFLRINADNTVTALSAAGMITALGIGATSGAYTANGFTLATARLLGRTTAGTGAAEELTMTGTGSVVVMATAPTLVGPIDQLAALPGTDNTYQGTVLTGRNAGATITQWQAVYLDSSGTWQVADANGSGTYPADGLAVAAYSSTNPATVLVFGVARNDAWNWTIGGLVYLSGTAGALTQTAPSTSGDKVQIIGVALTADSIFVRPSLDYITIT